MKIIPFEDKYRTECVSLLKRALNENFSEARFNWLHFQNPNAPSHMILAITNEKVVGFFGVIKKLMIINGREYWGGRDIDPTVDVDYRGKRIFSMLLQASCEIFDDIDVFYNFANKKSAPGFLKNGWKPLIYNDLGYWIHPPSITKEFLLAMYSRFRSRSRLKDVNVVRSSLNDYELNSRDKSEFEISISKHKEYLTWRYLDNPDREYDYFKITHSNEDIALIIGRGSSGMFTIVDLLNQSHFSNTNILSIFFNYFYKMNSKIYIQAWSQTAKDLRHLMIPYPIRNIRYFYVRKAPGRNFDVNVYNPKNWFMVPGESEFM